MGDFARFLGDVAGEETVAVGLLVEVAHELSPAQELADEALAGGHGGCAFGGFWRQRRG